MDDYHAFMSTSGGDSGGGSGCSTGCLPWILGGLAILYFIGKLLG